MQPPSHAAAPLDRFKAVGNALMRADLNNTHSGNMSLRDPGDPKRFFITASGSMCGSLEPEDIVPVSFSDMSWRGARKPSSETNTHRRVLELPGVTACVHCHAKAATAVSLESASTPVFLLPSAAGDDDEMRLFQPVDFFGAGLLGAVPAEAFTRAVGSLEMEERIPRRLSRAPLTLVAGHGPFARGGCLEECLHYLSVLENSARFALALRRRECELSGIQRLLLENGPNALFPPPRRPEFPAEDSSPGGEPAAAGSIAYWQAYNFDHGLSAFATGSVSCRIGADEMVFSPTAAAPTGIAAPRWHLALAGDTPHADDIRLHRRIYAHTPFNACVIAPAPLAAAEAAALLSAASGGSPVRAMGAAPCGSASELPVIIPIDAEAAFYEVRVPVAPPSALGATAPAGLIPEMLMRGSGCAVLAGVGVIAAGDRLDQAVYRLSLAERIAYFRQEAHISHRLLGGAPVAELDQG